MKTTLLALTTLALLAGAAGLAGPAAATCYYEEWKRVDPVPRDTGVEPVDETYVSIGYVRCNPPPP